MAKGQKYDNLSASELSRITRELGQTKPDVINVGEWAVWLRENDSKPDYVNNEAPAAAVNEANKRANDAGLGELYLTSNSAYDSLTIAELRDIADERNVDLEGAARKADIIKALEAADEEGGD